MLQISNLSKSYGAQVLFEEASMVINDGDRIGVIGRNGSGKSTLFKIILEQEHADSGEISTSKGYRIGHLAQHLTFTEKTVLAEACLGLPEDRAHEEYRAEIILNGLGFSEEDLQRAPAEFSGGFQIRINLARLLLSEPNLLLLDEPTNYLDIVSARWLAGVLRQWPNELMIITHDRAFMDSVTNHTMMLYRGKFKKLPGDSAKLVATLALEEEVYEKTRQNEAKKRKEIERFVERFRAQASKASLVQSRVKALARMGEKEELAEEYTLDFNFADKPFFGRFLLDVKDLKFGYKADAPLVNKLGFSVAPGDRIGIIGKNGRGKSTLLRLLAGDLQPLAGYADLSANTALSYFGQTNIERLNKDLRVEEEIAESNPQASYTRVRNICGTMMFSGDHALKKISVLSGGERSRVLLGKIIATPSNLLLLDEPTNHLDMDSVDALKEALKVYSGALLLVTHEESLLRELCTRLIIFQGEAPFLFEGNYDDFLERIGWEDEGLKPSSTKSADKTNKDKGNTKEIERRIKTLENQQKKMEMQLIEASEDGNVKRINELARDLTKLEKDLDAALAELVGE